MIYDVIIIGAGPGGIFSAYELTHQNPELKILDGILFKDSYGMAVKKGNTELLDTMNTVLQRLIDEGKIEEYIIEYSK